MADPVYLEDIRVWYGGYAIQGVSNSVSFRLGRAALQHGVFGDGVDPSHPGLLKPEVMVSGWYRSGAGMPDTVGGARVIAGVKTSLPVTLAPPQAPAATPGAAGNLAYLIEGADFKYDIGGKHGELIPYSLSRMPRSGGRVVRGTVILPASVVLATTTGTGYQLGAVAAGQRLVGAVHVLGVTGGTWTLTIESDVDNAFATPTTVLTFTGATAIGAEVKSVAGPITDTYFRAVLTKSGGTNCTAAVVLGIVPL